MFGRKQIRTGIDLGTVSVKLIRAHGRHQVEEVTHVGVEPWDFFASKIDVEQAAGALEKLLKRLGLGRKSLGRISVAVGGQDVSFREVELPPLSQDELDRALPFEARKHLDIEAMDTPVLASQILGPAPQVISEEPLRNRVLLAAMPQRQRDFPLRVLEKVGLEAEIVTLEPLVSLNTLVTDILRGEWDGQAVGLLDLGGRRASLHITRNAAGLLSRVVGPGAPHHGTSERLAPLPERLDPYLQTLVERITETITFYRGRQRCELKLIYVTGGGALFPGVLETLSRELEVPISILDPLVGLSETAHGLETVADGGMRFVTALGLCRWWDEKYVQN